MRTYMSLILVILCVAGFAQKQPKPKLNKVQPALDEGNYSEAKAIVDLAIDYEKTKSNPETWYLRGQVYAALDTANNEPGALEESLKAFDKALELDPEQKKINTVDFTTGSVVNVDSKKQGYYAYYYNEAIADYNDQNFEGATGNFESAFKIMPSDTNAILNAAYAAAAASMTERAKGNFKLAYEAGSTDKNIFLQMYNYDLQEENYESALENIQLGRKVYPNDIDFMKYEVNLFIQLKRTDEAREGLEKAIEADPNNADLLFALGVLKEETEDIEGAMSNYRKAIEVDPNHFNSNFNLAVYIFNEANEMNKKSNSLSYYPGKRNYKPEEKKEYEELQAGIKNQMDEALPLWEKLYDLDSTDETVLETLGYIYKFLDMKDKAEKLQAELDAVRG